MRVCIAGPRDLTPRPEEISKAVMRSKFKPTEIVSGGYKGVDIAGEQWARNVAEMPFHVIPAQWKRDAKNRPGPKRNAKLAAYADALIVIRRTGEKTSGTGSMIGKAREAGIPIHIEEVSG